MKRSALQDPIVLQLPSFVQDTMNHIYFLSPTHRTTCLQGEKISDQWKTSHMVVIPNKGDKKGLRCPKCLSELAVHKDYLATHIERGLWVRSIETLCRVIEIPFAFCYSFYGLRINVRHRWNHCDCSKTQHYNQRWPISHKISITLFPKRYHVNWIFPVTAYYSHRKRCPTIINCFSTKAVYCRFIAYNNNNVIRLTEWHTRWWRTPITFPFYWCLHFEKYQWNEGYAQWGQRSGKRIGPRIFQKETRPSRRVRSEKVNKPTSMVLWSHSLSRTCTLVV